MSFAPDLFQTKNFNDKFICVICDSKFPEFIGYPQIPQMNTSIQHESHFIHDLLYTFKGGFELICVICVICGSIYLALIQSLSADLRRFTQIYADEYKYSA
jgi:hypothetical protein